MTSKILAQAQAHAKVNLHLGVGAARADGYHELVTVFQSVSVADHLTLSVASDQSVGDTSSVVAALDAGATLGVPTDASNLAWQAVDTLVLDFQRRHGVVDLPQVEISLAKRIPVAGGMAGGSADAAAALVATESWLAREYGVASRPVTELFGMGASLGADVPFCLLGGSALGTNRGDQLTTMMSRGTFHWAMITNATGVSTAAVFAKLDELREATPDKELLQPHLDTNAVSQAMISGDPHALAEVLHNDLQPATLSLRPDLRAVYDSGMNAGALAAIISGSGPTWAFLCEDADQAQDVVTHVSADIAAASGMVVTSPAGGAGLVGSA